MDHHTHHEHDDCCDPDDPLEQQQLLVESSLEAVFEAYDEAVEEGVDRPVVWVIDCEDELGAKIAREWLGDEAVDEAIALVETEDDSETIVFSIASDWETTRDEASRAFPYLSEVFEDGPPLDGILVLGVTAGGASALTAPWEARPDGSEYDDLDADADDELGSDDAD